jgi:hypothetical protein|tara:strand:- start:23196 stop:23423 length:228 start_codon:yes stop_codon:yes gene_type:complete
MGFVASRHYVYALVPLFWLPCRTPMQLLVQPGALERDLWQRDVKGLDKSELPWEEAIKLHAQSIRGVEIVDDVWI